MMLLLMQTIESGGSQSEIELKTKQGNDEPLIQKREESKDPRDQST